MKKTLLLFFILAHSFYAQEYIFQKLPQNKHRIIGSSNSSTPEQTKKPIQTAMEIL